MSQIELTYKMNTEVHKVIKLLKELNVSDEIIAQWFIPDETETESEIIGSILLACQHANISLDKVDSVIGAVFPNFDLKLFEPEISHHTIEVEPDVYAEIVKKSGLPDEIFAKEEADE